MIYIGVDEQDLQNQVQFDEDGNPISNHGDGYVDDEKRKEELRNKKVYIPERRIEQMKAEYDCVVVRDFGDEYHLSEEEREEKNKFYSAFRKFSKFKHKYRKLDEYVVAMREAIKCLDFVADNNGVYTPDEFKKLFFRDKIYVNGLVFPKYSGRNKKNISWDYVTEFILSDRDPKEILPSKDDTIYSEEELEEMETTLFDEGELERILKPLSEEEITKQNMYYDTDEKEPGDNDNVVIFLDKKQSKKYIKNSPEFINEVKEIRQRGKSIENMARLAYDLTSADIDEIAQYDQLHNYKSKSDMPKFKGDMTNDDDYNRYLMELEEFEQENVKDNYCGKMKSLEEIEQLELKKVLESNGWAIRKLYDNSEREKKLKRIQKKEKQREKELKDKLIRVQNRRKRRMGVDVDDEPKKKKKKKKKIKDINKTKKAKAVNKLERDARESVDEFLLTASDQLDYNSFKEYEKNVTDWSWDNIMNGD